MDSPKDPIRQTSIAPPAKTRNFIRDKIDADLAAGRYEQIVTRFPPEPNGWLHIGHAKAICVNFGIALDYQGICRLRFDDTNPETEDASFVEAIQQDVAWLGFQWEGEPRFASDYFDFMYEYAVGLIEAGKAYVDGSSLEQIREGRGTVHEPGTPSPDRERSVDENLDLFARMKAGEFPDGAYVLRAKIDMASPNMLERDPLLYRIRHAHHYRTGDAWCLYPMYDYAHCLEDAYEGVTHSLCTLEFENNRAVYDWVLDNGEPPSRPHQTEFARLSLGYTVVSKRKLKALIAGGHVSGWDDPRMPTLRGLKRRGVRPEAIRAFAELIGVAKTDSLVDVGKLEFCIRDDLNTEAPRAMAVLRPLEVEVTNWPAGEVDELDVPRWPEDVGKPGWRVVPFAREIYVERTDFEEVAPKGWHRLSPGAEVRLRHAYLFTCEEVVKDDAGEVIKLRGTVDRESRGGNAPDGRRVKGTIHWVPKDASLPAEVRLYDRLFTVEQPEGDPERDFLEFVNPESLVVLPDARVEPSLGVSRTGDRFQFERQGYFVNDDDSTESALVFNRIVTLKDGWARKTGDAPSSSAPERKPKPKGGGTPKKTGPSERELARQADAELAARFARYTGELGVGAAEADVLAGARDVSDDFEALLSAGGASASALANWTVHELQGRADGRALSELPFEAAAFSALVGLVESGTITAPAGKQVLDELIETGGDPAAIVEARGLAAVSDEGALAADIAAVLAAHPDEVARLKAGEAKLMGFLMGQVMRATKGKAAPDVAKKVLAEQLAS